MPTLPLANPTACHAGEPPPRILGDSPELAAAAPWRRDPWKLFFPLGLALAWAGVLPWFLFGIGLNDQYLSVYHSMVQVQGFLTCFALGFLFTFLPRRTGTPPPAGWELITTLLSPVLLAGLALAGRFAEAQLFWLLTLAVLGRFAFSRVRAARVRDQIPPAFLWVALGLFWGAAGALLASAAALGGDDWTWLQEAGRTLVLQGVFTGMVLGTGAFLIPSITRGSDPSKVPAGAAWRRSLALHACGGLLWTAAAFVEPLVSIRLAFALRGAVALAVVLGTMELWLTPALPGLHRRLVWLAGWALPLGSLVVALDPTLRRAGLHLTFLGCFGLLVLSVGAHVSLSHAGRSSLLSARPWQLQAMAALVATALAARAAIDLAPGFGPLWFALAAGCFLLATFAWALLSLGRQAR